jgi:hypothetical protein
VQEIDYGKTAIPGETPAETRLRKNPVLNDPAVQQRIAQANNVGSAAGAAPAEAAAATAAPAEAVAQGPAAAIKNGLGKAVDFVKGAVSGGQPAAGAAPQRGLLSRIVNPSITLGRVAGFAKAGAAMAPAAGALEMAADTPDQQQQFAQSLGAESPNLLTKGARFLQATGDAATFGLASKLGHGISNVASGQPFFDQQQAPVAGPGRDHSAQTIGADGATPEGAITPAPATQLGQPMPADSPVRPMINGGPDDVAARRALVNKGSSDYTSLGNYGDRGTQIFGRSTNGSTKMNDFVGHGTADPNDPSRYAPSGVTLGVKPGEVEQYKQSLDMTGTMAGAPVFHQPGLPQGFDRAQGAVERAAHNVKLATSRPERNQALAELSAAQAVLGGLQAQHQSNVQQSEARFNGENSQFQHRLGYQAQVQGNQVNAANALANRNLEFAKMANDNAFKMLQANNDRFKTQNEQDQKAWERGRERIKSQAGAFAKTPEEATQNQNMMETVLNNTDFGGKTWNQLDESSQGKLVSAASGVAKLVKAAQERNSSLLPGHTAISARLGKTGPVESSIGNMYDALQGMGSGRNMIDYLNVLSGNAKLFGDDNGAVLKATGLTANELDALRAVSKRYGGKQ